MYIMKYLFTDFTITVYSIMYCNNYVYIVTHTYYKIHVKCNIYY